MATLLSHVRKAKFATKNFLLQFGSRQIDANVLTRLQMTHLTYCTYLTLSNEYLIAVKVIKLGLLKLWVESNLS